MPRASQHIVSDDEFEDDDLDELDESEGEEVKSTQKAAKKKGNLLFGALQKPRPVTLNTKQLHELIHHGHVNLNPEYQRDVVWTHAKQMGLIQSLFLNYYVPPIIFACATRDEDGETIRTAIDGKQRCTSIKSFIDGEIPFVAADRTKYWYRLPPGTRGKLLPDAMKRRFDMISLVVVEYDDVDDEAQRDIFQRVQLGVALTPAEKLQAIASPYTTWLSVLLKKYVFEDGTLRDLITWDTKRGKPFQSFASMAMWCQDPSSIGALSPPKYKAFLDRQDPPDQAFRNRFEKAISLLLNIANNMYDQVFDIGVINGRPSKTIAPIELWFMGYIIYSRMGLSSLRGLAETIKDMRTFARTRTKDLFTNTATILPIRDWLLKQPVIKPSKDEVVAAVEWEHHDDPSDLRSASKKRRREERERDEDPDYLGAPIARGSRSSAADHTRSNRGNGPSAADTRAGPASAGPSSSPRVKKSSSASHSATTPRVKKEPGIDSSAPQAQVQAPAPTPVSAPTFTAPPHQPQPRWANSTAPRPPPVGMDAQFGTQDFAQVSPMPTTQPPVHGSYGATAFDPRRANGNGFTSQQPLPQQQQQNQYYSNNQSQYPSQQPGGQYGYQQGWNGGR